MNAIEFIDLIFSNGRTEGNICLASYANPGEDFRPAHYYGRDPKSVEAFIKRYDVAGRAVYVCVSTVRGEHRSKQDVLELTGLFVDIDYKDHAYLATQKARVDDQVTAAVAPLECRPTIIVHTGRGQHLWWLFEKGIDAQAFQERAEKAIHALIEHLGGDPGACDVSRVLRIPGTHNSKDGDWVPVKIGHFDGPRYSLEQLEEWIAGFKAPLLRRAPQAAPGAAAADDNVIYDNPFTRAAREHGYHQHINVEAMLAAMGEGNVNNTLRDVSGALIARGQDPDEVFAILHERAAQMPHADANYMRRVDRKIRDLIKGALQKGYDKKAKQDEPPADDPPPKAEATNDSSVGGDDNVRDLGAEREKRKKTKPKEKEKKVDVSYVVAQGVINSLRDGGEDIMLTEGDTWLYSKGFWHTATAGDEQRLRGMILTGFETLEVYAKSAQLNLAWTLLTSLPSLVKTDVPWAGAGMIVCRNGVLYLDTGAFCRHSPDNYARRHIGATFTPGAKCPLFEALIADMFSNQGDDGKEIVSLIQEWTGAALSIASLARELRRALLLLGPSYSGKTQLAKIFANLIGAPIATVSVSEISGRFGLETLYEANAWIRDDATNEGDKLDPQKFKTIVTGEAVSVDRKGRTALSNVRIDIPVCLTCNTLPKARDGSDAIFNRSLVVRMTHVVTDDEAKAARSRIVPDYKGQHLADGIFELEESGILNWAILGLARLRRRGFYLVPQAVKDAITQFKDENNPIGEWRRQCIKLIPGMKVAQKDVVRAFNGWEHDQEGDEAVPRGRRKVVPTLMEQNPSIKYYQEHNGTRWLTGLALTEYGLQLWHDYKDAVANPGGFSGTKSEVNRVHLGEENDDAGETKF